MPELFTRANRLKAILPKYWMSSNKQKRRRITDLEAKLAALTPVAKDVTAGDPTWTTRNPGGLLGLAYSQSHTGIPVTWQSSLAVAAVYSAVKCLSEDVAKLPLEMRQALPKGGSKIETKHPLVALLRRPNYWQTPFEFWAFTVACHQLRGNAYIYILRDETGNPIGLIPCNPDRVTVLMSTRGLITYSITHPMLGPETIVAPVDDVIHIKGFVVGDAISGISPITVAADAVALGLATQRHAALLYGQGTMLGGVLSHPAKLSKESGERVASSWQAAYSGGASAHKVALLEEGMTFAPLTMTSIDSQLLEARKFTVIEISRLFRVPLSKLSDNEHSSFSNMEQMNQAYLDDGLMPITTRIEQALAARLLFDDEVTKYSFRFNFDEMLRADMKTRYASYQQGILSGWLSANDIRAAEGMEPIPGPDGQLYRFPVNTAPGTKPGVNTPDEVDKPEE